MFLVRSLTDLSLVEVASAFGKDHGTVIYAVKKMKKRCEDSAAFKSSVELIKRRLVRCGSPVESPRSRQDGPPANPRNGLGARGHEVEAE